MNCIEDIINEYKHLPNPWRGVKGVKFKITNANYSSPDEKEQMSMREQVAHERFERIVMQNQSAREPGGEEEAK